MSQDIDMDQANPYPSQNLRRKVLVTLYYLTYRMLELFLGIPSTRKAY